MKRLAQTHVHNLHTHHAPVRRETPALRKDAVDGRLESFAECLLANRSFHFQLAVEVETVDGQLFFLEGLLVDLFRLVHAAQ